MKISIPSFHKKSDLIDYMIKNKQLFILQKRSEKKEADAISYACPIYNIKGDVLKSEADVISENATTLQLETVINTTRLFDSHYDVHVDGLWSKSLKENKENYLVNQHRFVYEEIISDEVKAYCQMMTWKELGYDYKGETQALTFKSIAHKDRHPYMFEQYAKGRVKNHSVGMHYVKMEFACNDSRYEADFKMWEKYYPLIANKDDVDEVGFFWPQLESKVVEGSPVIKGSNFATPTISTIEITEGAGKTTPLPEAGKPLQNKSTHYLTNFY